MTPTQSLLFLAAWSALLIVACVFALGDARTREAFEQAEEDDPWHQKHASFDAAFADTNGRCWICTAPTRQLELVDAVTRYELACAKCAHTMKYFKSGRAA